jgi:hypothetical protein
MVIGKHFLYIDELVKIFTACHFRKETLSQSSCVIAKRLSGVVAISIYSKTYEIASVVTLPRNDNATLSRSLECMALLNDWITEKLIIYDMNNNGAMFALANEEIRH